MVDVLSLIGNGVTAAIGYIGDLLDGILTTTGDLVGLQVFLGLSVGMAIIGWGIKRVKSLIHGY